MLECVVNVSEGRDGLVIAAIAAASGTSLLDVHSDPHHHRSVLTLAGPDVADAARAVTTEAVRCLDLRHHAGVHPRLGLVDVVPFVPLAEETMETAIAARDRFGVWAATELDLPCFRYGPERSLPEVRRRAFQDLAPDYGPPAAHPSAGAICIGARPLMVAYNLWLADGVSRGSARQVAVAVRGPAVQALGLDVGGHAQVSLNLVDLAAVGPAEAYDLVATLVPVARAELVGLCPDTVLRRIPPDRWTEIGLSPGRTIEARLGEVGW